MWIQQWYLTSFQNCRELLCTQFPGLLLIGIRNVNIDFIQTNLILDIFLYSLAKIETEWTCQQPLITFTSAMLRLLIERRVFQVTSLQLKMWAIIQCREEVWSLYAKHPTTSNPLAMTVSAGTVTFKNQIPFAWWDTAYKSTKILAGRRSQSQILLNISAILSTPWTFSIDVISKFRSQRRYIHMLLCIGIYADADEWPHPRVSV